MKLKILILLGLLINCFACENKPKETFLTYMELSGKTMGTTYSVKYQDSLNRDFKKEIDDLLVDVNNEVSTYEPASFITRFNKSQVEVRYLNLINPKEQLPVHFKANFDKSKEVFKNSYGYYDPTIMPIVNYWGFGYTPKKAVKEVDKWIVDSLMTFVGFEKISQRSASDGWIYLKKEFVGVQLDFSAIAKGYGVDLIGQFLEDKGVQNYFVEIGGELKVKGKNPQNKLWTIGINKPSEKAALNEFQSKVELDNLAMATSGNYRNFYEVEGVKYAHTLNPKTGFPEKNTLLSSTVFARDCMSADAYATACMAMGLEKAKMMITDLKDVDAYFLFSDENGNIQSNLTNPSIKIID